MSAPLLEHIDGHQDEYVQSLREAVAIQSVSNDPSKRGEVVKMANWIKDFLVKHVPGSEVDLVDNVGVVESGKPVLPPLVVARIGPKSKMAGKKTLLVYAHYDVQPAALSDGWEKDPFALRLLADGKLVGRGSTDDKGPLMGWLNLFKTMVELGEDLPVNVRLISEGMEESGSEGFYETATALHGRGDFFKGVDYCVISDNYWLTTQRPCLTYGLRGVCCVSVTVTGPKTDLHSGMFGGQVYQPMDDLIQLLAGLKGSGELIKIERLYDQVAPVTEAEKKLYEPIHFSMEDKKHEIGVSKLRQETDKTGCLMSVWRQPSLTVHGIEGAYSEPGFKTVIPRSVVGKFSVRTVPNMETKHLEHCITTHLEREFAKLNSPNKLTIDANTGNWWYADPNTNVFQAAKRATLKIHKIEPDFTREGGSIPITGMLGDLTGCPVCLIPMGRSDDGAHAQNEKLDLTNYINGTKLFAAFLHELV